MKSNSPLFDRIRVKPDEDRRLKAELPACQWPSCGAPATHRAPKGRLRASEYWRFCLEHVREYNNSYNFFAGMSDDAIVKYQKEDLTGHRPTWKMGSVGGVGGQGGKSRRGSGKFRGSGWAADDPLNLFEGKALDVLGLEGDAKRADIKTRFKMLVKRHHPDANGGDRGLEDRLREIIHAYNYLKSAGFC
jgi:hypothetical protein